MSPGPFYRCRGDDGKQPLHAPSYPRPLRRHGSLGLREMPRPTPHLSLQVWKRRGAPRGPLRALGLAQTTCSGRAAPAPHHVAPSATRPPSCPAFGRGGRVRLCTGSPCVGRVAIRRRSLPANGGGKAGTAQAPGVESIVSQFSDVYAVSRAFCFLFQNMSATSLLGLPSFPVVLAVHGETIVKRELLGQL